MNEKDLKKEKEYLNYTKDYINTLIDIYQKAINVYLNDLNDQKEYVNTNRLDPQEINFMYQQMDRTCDTAEDYDKEVSQLKHVYNRPYFGKIDVKYLDTNENVSFYIGLKNIMRDMDFLVTDWRAPISSLYYDGNIGFNSFQSPAGMIDVELDQKRQFRIIDGELKYFFDTNQQIADDILQDVLSENTSNRMQNIVQTIQKEQNEIIKNNLNKNVIVDGVAGSGKTSVAMHRIAYMLYTYKDQLSSDNFIFISPNKLFTKYISNLLPELGEDNVPTFCFYDIVKQLKIPYPVDSKSEMIEDLLNGNLNRLNNIVFKNSTSYLNKLNNYLKNYNVVELFKDIKIGNNSIPVSLLVRALNRVDNTENINLKIESICEKIVHELYPRLSDSKQDVLINNLKRKAISNIDLKKLYIKFIKNYTFQKEKYSFKFEDIPTYAYMKMMVKGYQEDRKVASVVIDEMQDYDPISFKILKNLYPNAKFTMVGDYNQNLLFNRNDKSNYNYLFDDYVFTEMKKSYRSTDNISNFCFDILGEHHETNEIRKGEDPSIYMCKKGEMLENIEYYLQNNIDSSQKSAIICKNANDAKILSSIFKSADLVLSDDKESNNNLIITTPYFSKGLEFDNVLLYDVSDINYKTDIERQHLYVASTRALHRVVGFTETEPSKFISNKYIKNFDKKKI